MSATIAQTRMPAAQRRAEILEAAAVEFARTGLAGTVLETIATRAGISHPRIVQIFGTKRALFECVLEQMFDRIEEVFEDAAPGSGIADNTTALERLAASYLRLLRRERTIGPLMLQGLAAADEEIIRELVKRRYLTLQRLAGSLAGADPMQVRSLFAAGLVVTVSTVLDLPGARTDVRWAAWLFDLSTSQQDTGDTHTTTTSNQDPQD